ncbi:unnamed protein product [Clavelina lepadiformis]|uniref:Uncharacterized protein n=1 Tax=Clavelina lepadiformis TaxID=159417 RepID=A0ABP0GVY7_CLALP
MYPGNQRFYTPHQLASNQSQYLSSASYLTPQQSATQNSARYLSQVQQQGNLHGNGYLQLATPGAVAANAAQSKSTALSTAISLHLQYRSPHEQTLQWSGRGAPPASMPKHTSQNMQPWTSHAGGTSMAQAQLRAPNIPASVRREAFSPQQISQSHQPNSGQLTHEVNQINQHAHLQRSCQLSAGQVVTVSRLSSTPHVANNKSAPSQGHDSWQSNPSQISHSAQIHSVHPSLFSMLPPEGTRQIVSQTSVSSPHPVMHSQSVPISPQSIPPMQAFGNNGLKSPINLVCSSNHKNVQKTGSVLYQPLTPSPSREKRDKIRITFDQKQNQNSPVTGDGRRSSSADSTVKQEGAEREAKTPLVLENTERIVIDDDLEIVGTKEAEIMSHIRCDCPVHTYVRIESVSISPNPANVKSCSKCYCYICDKLAAECTQWTAEGCPHCNANTKSSCWKARRNMKRSPLMNLLTAEEIDQDITASGDLAMKYVVRIRETYITYRNGIPCEAYNVPCDCACHREARHHSEICPQCKAVHDMKKRFNYEPVRKIILETVKEIQQNYSNKPFSALVLFEALLSELCSHRPADFNHITRMPSNPDKKCQCNTPTIMEENIEWELIKIFTTHEVPTSFKEKFIKCVNASIQPLQLTDVLKRFMTMRHWDDLLLRAVISGQNTSGRLKNGDMLKENPLVMEMRVKKLDKENKFIAIVRYLKAVKTIKGTKHHTSDGTPISVALDKWSLLYTAKRGAFKDVCMRIADNIGLLKTLSCDFILELFTVLSGKDLPPNTELLNSFIKLKRPVAYTISQADKTVLILIYLIFMEVNKTAQSEFSSYLWFAKWVNETKLTNNHGLVRSWVQSSQELVEMSRQAVRCGSVSQYLLQCQGVAPQTALFTCSLLILQFLTRPSGNLGYVSELIDAYKNNEWALFYLFSQPSLMGSCNHSMVIWLTEHLKELDCQIGQFNQEALTLLITRNSFNDVCAFMKELIHSNWTNVVHSLRHQYITITAKFALRVINEASCSNNVTMANWISEIVFQQILEKSLFQEETLFPHCDMIGKASCAISMKNINLYKKLHNPMAWSKKVADVFAVYQQRFQRNLLNPEEIGQLLHYAAREGSVVTVKIIFSHFTEKHACSEKTTSLLMEEVVKILNSSQSEFAIKKQDFIIQYLKLCAHETLSWLICAKCSSKMPVEWKSVWKALKDNDMLESLNVLVKHTLQQFTSWMRELAVPEEGDVKRLLRCLEVFTENVVRTLLYCRFEESKLEAMIMDTRFYIASGQLRLEYQKIIEKVFTTIRREEEGKRKGEEIKNKLIQQQQIRALQQQQQQQQIIVTVPSTFPHSQPFPEGNKNKIITANENNGNIGNDITPNKTLETSNKNHHEPQKAVPKPPVSCQVNLSPVDQKNDKQAPPLKPSKDGDAEIRNNRTTNPPLKLKISSPEHSAPKSILTSPGAVEVRFCPQCGDSMSSSFKCSKCHARKSRDIACPNCKQVNRDLKGYSCRFCYTSLLEVLTTGEVKQAEPVVEKCDPPKKTKKLKRKKSENHTLSNNHGHQEHTEKHVKQAKLPRLSDSDENNEPEVNQQRPRLKTTIQKDKKEQFNIKQTTLVTSPTKPSKDVETNEKVSRHEQNHPRNVERHKAKAKEEAKVSQEHRNHEQLGNHKAELKANKTQKVLPKAQVRATSPPKIFPLAPQKPLKTSPKSHSNIFSNLKRDFCSNLSDSSDSSDSEQRQLTISDLTPTKVPTMVIKRKMETDNSSDTKKMRIEQPKRCSLGSSMSKRQKNILHRMKNIGKVKKSQMKSPKATPKSPPFTPEWEVAGRRRPGPLSRTSYYVVNHNWKIPRYIKIPYTLHLPKICFVHLSEFPPRILARIRHHQPELRLKKLYA